MNSTIGMELVFTNGVATFKPKKLPNWYGIEGIGFIWNGEWSDPEIEYKRKRINATIVENTMWERYRDDCEMFGTNADIDGFGLYMLKNQEEVYELIEIATEG